MTHRPSARDRSLNRPSPQQSSRLGETSSADDPSTLTDLTDLTALADSTTPQKPAKPAATPAVRRPRSPKTTLPSSPRNLTPTHEPASSHETIAQDIAQDIAQNTSQNSGISEPTAPKTATTATMLASTVLIDPQTCDRKIDVVVMGVPRVLSYLAPSNHEAIKPGTFVEIPLRDTIALGVIWHVHPLHPLHPHHPKPHAPSEHASEPSSEPAGEPSLEQLKPSGSRLEPSTPVKTRPMRGIVSRPALNESLCRYLARLSRYYVQDIPALIGLVVPINVAENPTNPKPKQAKTKDTKAKTSTTPSTTSELSPTQPNPSPPKTLHLRDHQHQAVNQLIAATSKRGNAWQPVVLRGPAGSGKTEVYIALIQSMVHPNPSTAPVPTDPVPHADHAPPADHASLRDRAPPADRASGSQHTQPPHHRQVLIMLPEIALVQPVCERLARYGYTAAAWHSQLTPRLRRQTWWDVLDGTCPILVGTRSALHLPYKDLRLIVVDEEHTASYKQDESTPRYHGRDAAILRAQEEQCGVVLVSATPSMETVHNIRSDRYQLVELHERFSKSPLSVIDVVDLRRTVDRSTARPTARSANRPSTASTDRATVKATATALVPVVPATSPSPQPPVTVTNMGSSLTETAREAIEDTIKQGRQALVYLNRRGYAPILMCDQCGTPMGCPNCDVPLTLHDAVHWLDRGVQRRPILLCHYCGYATDEPKECPLAASAHPSERQGTWKRIGLGIEQLTNEIRDLFPNAEVVMAASDTLRSPRRLDQFHQRVREGACDIIVGTQIMAKGHHFPLLTTVVVINADMGLASGDFRANEHVYNDLYQLAGRAGRENDRGHIIFQTFQPHGAMANVLQTIQDPQTQERFWQRELDQRQRLNLPPFSSYALIRVECVDLARLEEYCRVMNQSKPSLETIRAARLNDVVVFPPASAPIARLRNRYRYRFLLKAQRKLQIQRYIEEWRLRSPTPPYNVHVAVDIDPISFL